MKHTITLASLAILMAAASPAFAQSAGAQGSMQSGAMMQGGGMKGGGMMMQGGKGMQGMHMMGMHAMSGTVTNIDSQTGMVDLDAGGHALKLHFPPASLSDVKSGDKITVRMSFSKP